MVKKQKILFVSPVVPRINGQGVHLRAGKHVLSMSPFAEVHIVVIPLYSDSIDNSMNTDMKGHYKDFQIIKLHKTVDEKDRGNLLNSFFSSPASVPQFSDDRLERIFGIIKDIQPDIIFCFRLSAAGIFNYKEISSLTNNCIKWIDYDDIESIASLRSYQIHKHSLGKIYSFLNILTYFKLKYIEKKSSKYADVIFLCSDSDKKKLQKRGIKTKICVVPNVIDIKEQLSVSTEKDDKYTILFVGSMTYGPNTDGAKFFCREVLPLIKNEILAPINVYLVGYSPPPDILDLGKLDGVTVTGGVDSVIPYYQEANITVVPIRYGGGTRIKILESMALGRPIVSTTIGAEGIDIKNGENILISDAAEGFSQKCVELLKSPDLSNLLIQNGIKLINKKYSLKNNQKIFAKLLDNN